MTNDQNTLLHELLDPGVEEWRKANTASLRAVECLADAYGLFLTEAELQEALGVAREFIARDAERAPMSPASGWHVYAPGKAVRL